MTFAAVATNKALQKQYKFHKRTLKAPLNHLQIQLPSVRSLVYHVQSLTEEHNILAFPKVQNLLRIFEK